jgi:polyhydroxybutyrate depolymerase
MSALDSAGRPQMKEWSFVVDGIARRCLYMPARASARALVVELHGNGLDPERQLRASKLNSILWRERCALLLPQAAIAFQLMNVCPPGFAWNIPGIPLPGKTRAHEEEGPDDVSAVGAMAIAAQEAFGLVGLPLFVVGYSGGARLASYLVCQEGAPWSAAGLVAGMRSPAAVHQKPPPIIAFHGTADPINPYNGGFEIRWDIGVEETARRVASAQGCVDHPTEIAGAASTQSFYRMQNGDIGVLLVTLSGAGHAWPGSVDPEHCGAFGPCRQDVDASDTIWSFFATHLLRGEAGVPAGIGSKW